MPASPRREVPQSPSHPRSTLPAPIREPTMDEYRRELFAHSCAEIPEMIRAAPPSPERIGGKKKKKSRSTLASKIKRKDFAESGVVRAAPRRHVMGPWLQSVRYTILVDPETKRMTLGGLTEAGESGHERKETRVILERGQGLPFDSTELQSWIQEADAAAAAKAASDDLPPVASSSKLPSTSRSSSKFAQPKPSSSSGNDRTALGDPVRNASLTYATLPCNAIASSSRLPSSSKTVASVVTTYSATEPLTATVSSSTTRRRSSRSTTVTSSSAVPASVPITLKQSTTSSSSLSSIATTTTSNNNNNNNNPSSSQLQHQSSLNFKSTKLGQSSSFKSNASLPSCHTSSSQANTGGGGDSARKRKRVVSDRGKKGVEGVLAERDGDDGPVVSPFFTSSRNENRNGKGKGKEKEKEDLEEQLDMGERGEAIGDALKREAAMENGEGGPTVEMVAEGEPGDGAEDMSMMQDGDILAGLDEALATGGSSGFGGKKAPFALESLSSGFSLPFLPPSQPSNGTGTGFLTSTPVRLSKPPPSKRTRLSSFQSLPQQPQPTNTIPSGVSPSSAVRRAATSASIIARPRSTSDTCSSVSIITDEKTFLPPPPRVFHKSSAAASMHSTGSFSPFPEISSPRPSTSVAAGPSMTSNLALPPSVQVQTVSSSPPSLPPPTLPSSNYGVISIPSSNDSLPNPSLPSNTFTTRSNLPTGPNAASRPAANANNPSPRKPLRFALSDDEDESGGADGSAQSQRDVFGVSASQVEGNIGDLSAFLEDEDLESQFFFP